MDLNKRDEYRDQFKLNRVNYKKKIMVKKRNCFKEYISTITSSGTLGSAYSDKR